jgi:hypothetical protein
MDENVLDVNPAIEMTNSPRPRIISINHGISVIAQSPLPTVLSPLLGMKDSEIAHTYASFLRHAKAPDGAPRDPLLVPFERSPSPKPPRNPLLGIDDPKLSNHHPNPLPPEASLYEILSVGLPDHITGLCCPNHSLGVNDSEIASYHPIFLRPAASLSCDRKGKWLSPFTRPSSPVLPEFEPQLHWRQPFYVPVREDVPDDDTGNYLTDVDFDDPTKPYPVPHERSVRIPSKHRLIQRLVLSNPSAFHKKLQDAEFAHCFDQFGRLLDELACDFEPDIQNKGSFDEIKQCLLNSHKALSVGQLRRMADILVAIARMEWGVKKGLGYGLDESLKYDDRFMMDMWRRTRLARAAMADKEEELDSFIEPLEPLFGWDIDNGEA